MLIIQTNNEVIWILQEIHIINPSLVFFLFPDGEIKI